MNIAKQSVLSFFVIAIACVVLVTPAKGQKLHVLVVADQSEWAQWGEHLPNILIDMVRINLMLENNVPSRQLNLQPMTIEQYPGSPGAILGELQRFSVGPKDTLMFYFTGHGEADDKGHFLNLEKGKLYRSKIKQTMLDKNPRLAVIITDCCNVRNDKFAYLAPFVQSDPPRQISPLFKTLFFDPAGFVDVNGSSPGESAHFFVEKDELDLPKGSLFSRTLTEYVDENSRRSASWDELLTKISFQVHESFRRNYPRGVKSSVKGQRTQQGQTVYAIAYPGMPDKKGPRTGISVRDHGGTGALIIDVRPDHPGTRVFDLANNKYVSLQKDQVITAADGQVVSSAKDFDEIVRVSPRILRLTINDPKLGKKEYLMRLRY